MSYTQHCITTMAAPSWKCLPAADGDLQQQGLNDSGFGSASETASQEDRGLSFLLKQEDREIQGAYRQLFTKLDVALKEMKQYVTQINRCVRPQREQGREWEGRHLLASAMPTFWVE